MFSVIRQFAAEESGDLFGALGIDWTVLILQSIAFIILVLILAKFVYPPILAMLDRKDKLVEDSLKSAKEAQEKAAKSEVETAKLLKQAHAEAGEIVANAKTEAANIVAAAEEDAAARAETIVKNARADLQRDVEAARKALRSEVVELVGLATEKVVSEKIDANDEKLIAKIIKEQA